MRIRDIVAGLKPGEKIRLTVDGWTDGSGKPKWTPALSDAQQIAYMDSIVSHTHTEGDTVYCVVVDGRLEG